MVKERDGFSKRLSACRTGFISGHRAALIP
jgi:hypothetical protein